jgi:hypothetical protein
VAGIGSESCVLMGFGIYGVKYSNDATIVLSICTNHLHYETHGNSRNQIKTVTRNRGYKVIAYASPLH